MTIVDGRRPRAAGPPAQGPAAPPGGRRVVLALARVEARRMLRSPWLLAGAVLSGLLTYQWQGPQQWNGQRYGDHFILASGLYAAASLIVAGSFHREQLAVAAEAPAGAVHRLVARLLGAGLLVAVVAAFTAGFAVYVWSVDGLDLGTEPGRTLHAFPTLPELLQPVVVTVLAVAAGAAAGRRLHHRATSTLVLLLAWFPVTLTYWAFQAPPVAPFSVLLAQPVPVDVGPPSTDPSTFPAAWLLEPPGEYQDHWARLVVSESLAWWHLGWLLGLAALLLAVAVPRGRGRRALVLGGVLTAVVCVVAQLAVHPS